MTSFLFSCEYATCTVPLAYAELFHGANELVSSAAGWDPGALNMAQACAMRFRTPLVHAEVTRLLLDVEQEGDARWSQFSKLLSESSQRHLTERYHQPYKIQLHQRLDGDLARYGRVLHVMVHTDDGLGGQIVLETPPRGVLAELYAAAWISRMNREDLVIRHARDSIGTPLSRELVQGHPPERYAQIRLRVSQSFFLMGLPWRWATIKKHLLDSLSISTQQMEATSLQP